MIEFRASDHTYWSGKVQVPGVTSVMQPYIGTDFSFVDPDVLEAASQLGRRVHAMVEADVKMGLGDGDVDFDLIAYFDAWREFRHRSGFEPDLSEQLVYSPTYGYAGQLDLAGDIGGDSWIIDVKRVTRVSKAAAVQTAAYKQAMVETFPEAGAKGLPLRRAALQFTPDGKYKLHEYKDPNDLRVFLSCLTIHQFKSRNP